MKIKELRLSRNLTQKAFAKVMNVSPQTILNRENEISFPSLKQLIEIADYFNVTIDFLVDRSVNNIDINQIINYIKKTNTEVLIKKIKDYIK